MTTIFGKPTKTDTDRPSLWSIYMHSKNCIFFGNTSLGCRWTAAFGAYLLTDGHVHFHKKKSATHFINKILHSKFNSIVLSDPKGNSSAPHFILYSQLEDMPYEMKQPKIPFTNQDYATWKRSKRTMIADRDLIHHSITNNNNWPPILYLGVCGV